VLDAPAADATELLFRVNAAANYFKSLDRGWNFYVCEDLLDPRTVRKLDDLLDGMSLIRILDAPGMETAELDEARRELPVLDFAPVGDDRTRKTFTELISDSFHIPYPTAKVLYEPEERWHARLRAWVGYASDGTPATCAAAVVHAGALGIYSVATAPERRRRGHAEAIVRHMVSTIREGGFAGPLVLQSTPDGRRLYRAMGFRRTTRFAVYATI
jgi:ribosomal protein S18 acetylase RimI-like enzyme